MYLILRRTTSGVLIFGVFILFKKIKKCVINRPIERRTFYKQEAKKSIKWLMRELSLLKLLIYWLFTLLCQAGRNFDQSLKNAETYRRYDTAFIEQNIFDSYHATLSTLEFLHSFPLLTSNFYLLKESMQTMDINACCFNE